MTSTAPLTGRETFEKLERLCSRKIFGELIKEGRQLKAFPFRITWIATKLDSPFPVQAAFAVPKRNFKKSVDRNRVKRLMREVYRKNKAALYTLLLQHGKQYAIMFVYNGNRLPDYTVTEEKLKLLLERFAEAAATDIE